ncbi:hypothetical protein [Roseibium sediminicola]|uniref:Uncharacterized protein n=1 Tax=Roseibium sediminicola TaxID=2933272 RepID=A0ABT0GTE8_9HYPH|nr:hypothetical protein [Roseibium sp. CAU 1639]MCK7612708.1 hypothetical protein [Roseibium sp. CAU 1639]
MALDGRQRPARINQRPARCAFRTKTVRPGCAISAPGLFAPHIPATASAGLQALFGRKPPPRTISLSNYDDEQNQKDLNRQKVIPAALPVSLKDAIVKGNKQQSF